MRFSVIVPIYNAAPTLKACLDSIVAAVDENSVEVICVNDGSTDGSVQILDEYVSNLSNLQALKPSNFRVLHQPNAGPGAARNAALDVATGDIVVFVDADDTLEPEAFARLAETDADIVTFLPPAGRWDLSKPADRLRLFSPLVGNLLVWNAAYRRAAIGDWRFPDLKNHEDLVWTTGMFARAKTVVSGMKPWYVHRTNVFGSLSNTYSWRRVRDGIVATWQISCAARGTHAGIVTRLVLLRKLAMHFLLHVVAVVPRGHGRTGR